MVESRSGVRKWLTALRQPEPVLLAAVLVVVAAVLAFAKIADEVAEHDTQTFDERVLKHLRCADDPSQLVGPAWLGPAARDVSSLGGSALLLAVTLGAAGFLLLAGNRRMMWLVLLAPASGTLASAALKAFFARPRPSIVPHLETVTSFSFPSGHSMLSAIVYLTLGALLAGMLPRRRMKIYVLTVAVLITVLVGLSRVLLGVHYPTDVLAGWAAGLVWALLWWLGARRPLWQGRAQ
jgi:undecaprenyl-diphosphatase